MTTMEYENFMVVEGEQQFQNLEREQHRPTEVWGEEGHQSSLFFRTTPVSFYMKENTLVWLFQTTTVYLNLSAGSTTHLPGGSNHDLITILFNFTEKYIGYSRDGSKFLYLQ